MLQQLSANIQSARSAIWNVIDKRVRQHTCTVENWRWRIGLHRTG